MIYKLFILTSSLYERTIYELILSKPVVMK